MTLFVNGKKVCISKKLEGEVTGIPMDVVDGVYKVPSSVIISNVNDIGDNALRSAYIEKSIQSVSFPNLTMLSGSQAMYYAFYGCNSLTSVDFSSLTTVSGSQAMYYAFYGCYSLTSVHLSSLTTISGGSAMQHAFRSCSSLTSVDFSSLTTISGSYAMNQAFYNSSLTSVTFPSLTTIGANSSSINCRHFYQAFYSCYNLTSLSFPELTEIYCTGSNSAPNGTFYGNNRVQKMYFPKLTTMTYGTGASSSDQGACNYIFSDCSSLTELHFGAANQAAIEASPGYSTAWGRGAGNVTIYFDL